jgi:hypothetical protein
LRDATALFARLRAVADPAEIALATRAASIARHALASVSGSSLAEVVAAAEREARMLGAEEVYLAAAPDLARDRRLARPEGGIELGATFALRATVAYKGTWVRLVRSFGEDGEAAAVRFAAAVAQLPDERGFAGMRSWLVEGCRTVQPLEPLMGSRMVVPAPPVPRALVSVQASLEVDRRVVLVGAPALIGAVGEAASLLVAPVI